VQYRWHPLYGSKLRLIKIAKSNVAGELHCELPDGMVIGLPRWMTDAGCCGQMEIADPVVAVAALEELRALLDGLKSPSTRSQ